MPGGIDEKVVTQRVYEYILFQGLVVVKCIPFFTQFTGGPIGYKDPFKKALFVDILDGSIAPTGTVQGFL
jgi:hypothetical protein